jgi:hypothetical protein
MINRLSVTMKLNKNKLLIDQNQMFYFQNQRLYDHLIKIKKIFNKDKL